jgi:hypothetical protein
MHDCGCSGDKAMVPLKLHKSASMWPSSQWRTFMLKLALVKLLLLLLSLVMAEGVMVTMTPAMERLNAIVLLFDHGF